MVQSHPEYDAGQSAAPAGVTLFAPRINETEPLLQGRDPEIHAF